MKIYCLEVGMLATNCYIAVNEKLKEGVILDPGADANAILKQVEKLGIKITAIFITHGHSDHIMALNEVREKTGACVYISREDADMLTKADRNLSMFIGETIECAPAEKFYSDGDVIEEAGLKFDVLATPGHTKGGVCLKYGDIVFCGDTVFCESIGRIDFPGGSYLELLQSIRNKLLPLDDETKLLPGHGPATTVGWERRRNPFLQ
ncbi:MAG: MBL fold metallo-hydrolase [Phascolarctobacterium sp.]|nr:MBL fold metallo-hydrolase [Phascolarctobacterium sp.]